VPRAEPPSGFVSLQNTPDSIWLKGDPDVPAPRIMSFHETVLSRCLPAWSTDLPVPGPSQALSRFRKPIRSHQRATAWKGDATAQGHPSSSPTTSRFAPFTREETKAGREKNLLEVVKCVADVGPPGSRESCLGLRRNALPAICLFPPASGAGPALVAPAGPAEAGACPASPTEFQ